MNPGQEPPEPRTEAIQNNTNPLSAESAVPLNRKAKGEPVRIKIDDQWYDCRGWAAAHPGGERWIHFFDGRDGTDVFYALHSYGPNGSSKAVDRLAKLPRCDPPPEKELKKPSPSEYAASMSFRDLRKKLEKDGFFQRNVFKEAWALVQVVGLYVAGQFFAYSNPFLVGFFPFFFFISFTPFSVSRLLRCLRPNRNMRRRGSVLFIRASLFQIQTQRRSDAATKDEGCGAGKRTRASF